MEVGADSNACDICLCNASLQQCSAVLLLQEQWGLVARTVSMNALEQPAHVPQDWPRYLLMAATSDPLNDAARLGSAQHCTTILITVNPL